MRYLMVYSFLMYMYIYIYTYFHHIHAYHFTMIIIVSSLLFSLHNLNKLRISRAQGFSKPLGADSGQAAEAQSYSADGSGLAAGLLGLRWLFHYIRNGKD